MFWTGFVELGSPKCTISHDIWEPAIQTCNFCSFMIFISIWLCFWNRNSKSMAWRKANEAMNSDSCLLTSADWPQARWPWPMATDPWAMNPDPWALGSGHGPRAPGPESWQLSMEFIFFNEKHAKFKKKHVFNWKSMFFCFSSFAAVFYYKILFLNKSMPK